MKPSIRTFQITTKKKENEKTIPSSINSNYRLFIVSMADQDRLHDSMRCIFNIWDNLRDYLPINIFYATLWKYNNKIEYLLPAIKRFYNVWKKKVFLSSTLKKNSQYFIL